MPICLTSNIAYKNINWKAQWLEALVCTPPRTQGLLSYGSGDFPQDGLISLVWNSWPVIRDAPCFPPWHPHMIPDISHLVIDHGFWLTGFLGTHIVLSNSPVSSGISARGWLGSQCHTLAPANGTAFIPSWLCWLVCCQQDLASFIRNCDALL